MCQARFKRQLDYSVERPRLEKKSIKQKKKEQENGQGTP